MQRTDATFIIRGRVGKGIYHNNKNGVETTSFSLGVVKSRMQNSQNYEWDSIPILAFGNIELTTGEYVTAVGRIGISRKEKQTTPILLCDSVGKTADRVQTQFDKPQTPDERSDNFYGNNSNSGGNDAFPSDSDIPF